MAFLCIIHVYKHLNNDPNNCINADSVLIEEINIFFYSTAFGTPETGEHFA